jgi:hypothetical protein
MLIACGIVGASACSLRRDSILSECFAAAGGHDFTSCAQKKSDQTVRPSKLARANLEMQKMRAARKHDDANHEAPCGVRHHRLSLCVRPIEKNVFVHASLSNAERKIVDHFSTLPSFFS